MSNEAKVSKKHKKYTVKSLNVLITTIENGCDVLAAMSRMRNQIDEIVLQTLKDAMENNPTITNTRFITGLRKEGLYSTRVTRDIVRRARHLASHEEK